MPRSGSRWLRLPCASHLTTVTAAVVAQPPPAYTPTLSQPTSSSTAPEVVLIDDSPTPTELELSIQREQQLKTKGLANDKAHQGLVSELAAVHSQLAASQAKVKAGEGREIELGAAASKLERVNADLACKHNNVEPPKKTALQHNADMAALAEKQAESARWVAAMARANILTSRWIGGA
ncbi:MAG: hypothetical protein WDW36_008223 [Sanguina aurantia]